MRSCDISNPITVGCGGIRFLTWNADHLNIKAFKRACEITMPFNNAKDFGFKLLTNSRLWYFLRFNQINIFLTLILITSFFSKIDKHKTIVFL